MIFCLPQKISGREIAGVWKLARLVTADWSIGDSQRWREMSERLAAKYRNGSNLWLDDKKEERELVSGDSEAFRKFPDKYILPEKLVAEYAEHLAQIKMGKVKKKEETERERMERPNWEYSDIDWVGLYNSDKLSSLRVDELSLYFSHHKITFKGKKAARVAMIKAHIGSLLYDSMECQQPRQPLLRNMQQEVTSSLSGVETDSQWCSRSSCRFKPE